MRSELRNALLVALIVLASACTPAARLRDYGISGDRLELSQTAFFPNEEVYGAPGALAMMLYTDGAQTRPENILPLLSATRDGAALRPTLANAARKFERVPYPLAANADALFKELRGGRPVLVLLNLETEKAWPLWRYAVLIGFDPAANTVLLRSGKEGRVAMKLTAFLKSWRDGGDWALIVTQPAKIPATASPDSWIASTESFTAMGKPELAEAAAEAASQRWPEQVLPWIALGNARYLRKDFPGAEAAYVRAQALKSDNPVVHNNLALVLLERRCLDLAVQEIAKALQAETDPKLRASYAETQNRIKRYSGPAIFCAPPGADGSAPIEYDVLPLNPDSPPARAKPRKPRQK